MSTLGVGSSYSIDLEGGTPRGFGTISGNLVNTGGTILPGVIGTAGTLTVDGNYSDPNAYLHIQIGGATPGSALSQLDVLGKAALGGTLEVSLIDGFVPTIGEEFVILTSTGLSGTFTDSVIHDGRYTFTVEYSPAGYNNDVVLGVTTGSVPEPASLVLLGLGMAGVAAWSRKSRKPSGDDSTLIILVQATFSRTSCRLAAGFDSRGQAAFLISEPDCLDPCMDIFIGTTTQSRLNPIRF